MRVLICLIVILLSGNLYAEEVNMEKWLLWHSVSTKLPFASALTIYPPINLQVENEVLTGSIAVPYSSRKQESQNIEDFLIVVEDNHGKAHFLHPKTESVGFVNGRGLILSSLRSGSFKGGQVKIELYKTNSAFNRDKLREREAKALKKQRGVNKALTELSITKPVLNEKWQFNATTLDHQKLGTILAKSTYTVVQLYSPNCGFCQKSIPFNNQLNQSKGINIVGLAGVKSNKEFKQHLSSSNIQYPFISFEGEFTESALLKAVGQEGTPTYLVLDQSKSVRAILVGTPEFEHWLTTIDL